MIFIGDLYQLPPVIASYEKELITNFYKTVYFFSANIFEELALEFVELEKIYRQKDEQFISLLNAIRNNTVTDEGLTLLNQRLDENFEPNPKDFYIHLTPTRKLSQEINERQLQKLKGKLFSYEGTLDGKFDNKNMPTDIVLKFKKGSQVMLLNNDSYGRWVNGSIGKIIDIEKGKDEEGKDKPDIIWIELSDGKMAEVEPHTWEIFNYSYNKQTDTLESESVGSFTQYPIMLAWSVTIHKSQ